MDHRELADNEVVDACVKQAAAIKHWSFECDNGVNVYPAESFTRWDALWNHQTNVNPDE